MLRQASRKLLTIGLMVFASWSVCALESPVAMRAIYATEVDRRLEVPEAQAWLYADMLDKALNNAGLTDLTAQYVVLVDRSPMVQAVFVYWKEAAALPQLIGASPVSTGRPGQFDHFATPTGVFPHTVDNPDFRAEGTRNKLGIRGYGSKGMRVFDFGWQHTTKGWGDHSLITMRLQMHATDPDLLERRLGSAQSKGCIRIPATLNRLIDHYGLLDADYERAMRDGQTFWMLDATRQATPWSGRYLIVVDSQRAERPLWAPAPTNRH